jgi:hypothetical protein
MKDRPKVDKGHHLTNGFGRTLRIKKQKSVISKQCMDGWNKELWMYLHLYIPALLTNPGEGYNFDVIFTTSHCQ